ncbi:MAG: hypoxanthine phosphoribosyltransferase [Planctomycetota bacterium]|jgi:hypoxanthine phosphoribosyltransferase
MTEAPACLYSADAIAVRVRELATQIRARYPDDSLTLLGILTGSVIFTADLARAVGEPVELSFVHARSYGKGTVSAGKVTLGGLEDEVVRGRTVVVADTILDTGHTLSTVVAKVRSHGAAEVATCVLLDKPARREVRIDVDWVGFEVPNRFLVGYGLDHGGLFRALDYVGALEDGTDG